MYKKMNKKVGMLLQKRTDTRGVGISSMRKSIYLLKTTLSTVAAPGGFLGFLETSQDSGSTDQIVNTDGPLPAAVTVNKTP